jgi:hypothetical protein
MSKPQNMDSPSLKYNNSLPKSFDYFFLRKEGIRYVQEMSGNVWTDYNEHDPGVTILEQCCFALTDLAYRTNIDIEKILFTQQNASDEESKSREDVLLSNCIYYPEDVLLTSKVTLTDLKILFIDNIPLISNIWFNKVENSGVIGLYDVYVRPSTVYSFETHFKDLRDVDSIKNIFVAEKDYKYETVAEKELLTEKKVRSLFNANRNICEEINNVIILQPDDIEISIHLDLFEEVRVEEALAEIYHRLDKYFNSKIHYESIDSLESQNVDHTEIFDCPSFDKKKGFIKKTQLEEYQTIFSISKVFSKISEVPGVRFARDLVVRQNEIKVTGDQLIIPDGCYASIASILTKSSFTVAKKGNLIDYNLDRVKILCIQKTIEGEENGFFNRSTHGSSYTNKNTQDLIKYSSIQNLFPATYGIGQYGLSDEEDLARKLSAKQLQGYLLFFDQILLNHLTQLKNVASLFSIDTEISKTYFENYPSEIPDLNAFVNEDKLKQDIYDLMDDNYLVRKSMFLDHLLARFSEKFIDESQHNLKNVFGVYSTKELKSTLVKLKSSFLSQYRNLSKNKNVSFNYEIEITKKDSLVIPFKAKLFLLLNLPPENQGSVSLLGEQVLIPTKDVSEKERGEMKDKGKSLMQTDKGCYKTFEKTSANKVTFLIPEGQEALSDLMYYGARKGNYSVIKNNGLDSNYTVFYKGINDLPIALYSCDSDKEAKDIIVKLLNKFSDINKKSEGFHVLEHLLLRSVLDDQYHLNIHVESKGEEKYYFESVKHSSYEENKQLMFDAILLALDRNNFIVVETKSLVGDGLNYTIVLRDKNNLDLVRLNREFETSDLAISYIEKVVLSFFRALSEDSSILPKEVVFKPAIDKEGIQSKLSSYGAMSEFYNNKISLIFPDWLPRFNEPDFREMLLKSITSCLPAHIYADIKWFDKKKMRAFEDLYFEWLELKRQYATNGFNLNMFKDYTHLIQKNDLEELYKQRIHLDNASSKLRHLLMENNTH